MIDKLIGNNHIKEVFKRMFEKDRIPRSLLFVGENGIGKKQFALKIAKSFVCHNLQNAQACDVCSACKRAEKFSLPKSNDKDELKRLTISVSCWTERIAKGNGIETLFGNGKTLLFSFIVLLLLSHYISPVCIVGPMPHATSVSR
ncbi:MAG: hypothetical protein MUC29_08430 [Pyrinomonadaceae bacterium]|nr:hypothetical protein [Pyrinomonadaceae bacterium]